MVELVFHYWIWENSWELNLMEEGPGPSRYFAGGYVHELKVDV